MMDLMMMMTMREKNRKMSLKMLMTKCMKMKMDCLNNCACDDDYVYDCVCEPFCVNDGCVCVPFCVNGDFYDDFCFCDDDDAFLIFLFSLGMGLLL